MECVKYTRRGRGFEGRTRSNVFFKREHRKTRCETTEWTPLKSLEGWIIFVTNLHEETTEDDVREAFSEYGEVKNLNVNLDRRTGFVKGYALIEYESYEQAVAAIEYMNDSELLGVSVKVDWCFRNTK